VYPANFFQTIARPIACRWKVLHANHGLANAQIDLPKGLIDVNAKRDLQASCEPLMIKEFLVHGFLRRQKWSSEIPNLNFKLISKSSGPLDYMKTIGNGGRSSDVWLEKVLAFYATLLPRT